MTSCDKLQHVAKMLGWTDENRRRNLIPATEPARVPDEARGEYVMFSAYVLSGLNFPMSRFLKIVQDFYGIVLAKLSPNSILMLSGQICACGATSSPFGAPGRARHWQPPDHPPVALPHPVHHHRVPE